MEKWDSRLFQRDAGMNDHIEQDWNIVELESRRDLYSKINELIELTNNSTLTTSDMQRHLHLARTHFGSRFVHYLVRALQREQEEEREAIVWLLTVLNDKDAIAPLQYIAQNNFIARSVRLSASLALAGMGATREMNESNQRRRLYAIS